MTSRRCVRMLTGAAACLFAAACQTVSKEGTPPAVPETEEFQPAAYVSTLRLEKGGHANLFSPESFAVWLGPDVAALRRAKAQKEGETLSPNMDAIIRHVTDNYLVFECHLASIFPDMSIGYDAVRLRGMTVQLEMPDGRKITPIQVVSGNSEPELQVGALRRFARTSLVVFQKQDLRYDKPTVAAEVRAARLVLTGYDCRFYFEWGNAIPPAQPWIPNQDEYLRAVKTGLKESYEKVAEFFHVLQ